MHLNIQPALEVDFSSKALRFRQQAATTRNEAIAKAVGLKKNKACKIIDTTAGLGTDAFILASLGADVILLERSNTIATLLRKGLERLDQTEIRSRMQLIETEACDYLSGLTLNKYPDVIYCDPMFPERQKSALVKKEMRYLQTILSQETFVYNEEALLKVALEKAKTRVVVKRPRLAPCLAGPKPSFSQPYKSNRFDIYLIPCTK
jgi:16S rRNA (guanine1516-N2)-methyltransferase